VPLPLFHQILIGRGIPIPLALALALWPRNRILHWALVAPLMLHGVGIVVFARI